MEKISLTEYMIDSLDQAYSFLMSHSASLLSERPLLHCVLLLQTICFLKTRIFTSYTVILNIMTMCLNNKKPSQIKSNKNEKEGLGVRGDSCTTLK